MNIQQLADTPPWEWPRDAAEVFSSYLQDTSKPLDDRVLAAQLSGDLIVMNDSIAELLLSIIENPANPEELRATASIALGPALEESDLIDFEDEEEDPIISEPLFRKVQKKLQAVYDSQDNPKLLRRRALEASIRAPQPWHETAINSAWSSADPDWKLTAIFCMRFVQSDFETQILEALKSTDEELRFEALLAAGNNEIDKAWPVVAELLKADTDHDMLLAAIEASAEIRPQEARGLLRKLAETIDDEEIGEAIEDALEQIKMSK